MKRLFKSILCGIISLTFIMQSFAFAEVGKPLTSIGALPEELKTTPHQNSAYTSEYAPWLELMHITTESQANAGVLGGEACQQVRTLAISPHDDNFVLFGTDTNGLWKSTDGGKYWYNVGSDYYHFSSIQDIFFHPANPDIVYMVSTSNNSTGNAKNSLNDGIYRSKDKGETWEHVLHTLYESAFFDKLITADDSGNIYAVSGGGIFKSDNDGDTWETLKTIDESITNGCARSLSVSEDGKTIIAAFGNTNVTAAQDIIGLHYSTDGGATWNITAPYNGMGATTTDFNPKTGDWYVCFEGINNNNMTTGIYKSNDNGKTWNKVCDLDAKATISKFALQDDGEYRFYIMMNCINNPFRYSDDYGINWSQATFDSSLNIHQSNSGYYAQGFDVSSKKSGVIFAAQGGINKSVDGGEHFVWSNSGNSGLNVSNIAFDSSNRMYLSCADVGPVISDNSYTASECLVFEMNGRSYGNRVLTPDPDHSQVVIGYDVEGDLFKSTDGGKTYEVISNAEVSETQTFIEYDKANHNIIYTNNLTSVDHGASWTPNKYRIDAISPIDQNVFYGYRGTGADTEVWISKDKGSTWSFLGKPGFEPQGTEAKYLYPDTSDVNSVVVVGQYNMAKLELGKDTPTLIGSEIFKDLNCAYFWSYAQNPNDSNHMLLGVGSNNTDKNPGLLESRDGGNSWHVVKGIFGHRVPYYIKFSPVDGEAFICSMNGIMKYNYNTYDDYFVDVTLDNGIDAPYTISKPEGAYITLPTSTIDGALDVVKWNDGNTTYTSGAVYTVPANDVSLIATTGLNLKVLESKTYRFEYSKEETAADWGTPTVNINPGKAYVGTSANSTTKYDCYTYIKFDASALINKASDKAILKVNFNRNWNSGKRIRVYDASIKNDLDNGVAPTDLVLINESNDSTAASSVTALMEVDVTKAITSATPYIEIVLYSDAYGKSPSSIPYVVIDDETCIACAGVEDARTITFANTMGDEVAPMSAKSGATVILPNCTSTAAGYFLAGWNDGTNTYAVGAEYTVPSGDVTLTAVWNIALPVAESKTYRFEYSKEETATDWGTPTVNNNPGKAYVGTSASKTTKYDCYTYVKFDASAMEGKVAEKAVLNINFIRNWNAGKVLEVYSADIKNDLDNSVAPTNKTLIANSVEVTSGSNTKELMNVDVTSVVTGGQYIELVLYSESWGGDPNCVPYVFIDDETCIACAGVEDAYTITFTNTEGVIVAPMNAKEGNAVTLPDCVSDNKGYVFSGWSDGTTTYAAGDEYTMPGSDVTLTAVWSIVLPVTESKTYRFEYSKEETATDWGTPTVNNNPGKAYVGTSASKTTKYDCYTYVKFDASDLIGKISESVRLKINFNRNWNAGKRIKIYDAGIKSDLDNGVVPSDFVLISESEDSAAASSVTALIEVDITSLITGNAPYIELVLYSDSWGNDPSCVPYVVIDDETSITCVNAEEANGFYSIDDDGKLNRITKLTSGKIRCYTKVNVDNDGTATPFIALMRGKYLDEIIVGKTFTTVAGTNYVYADIDLTEKTIDSTFMLKKFVFGDLQNITPLTEAEYIVMSK